MDETVNKNIEKYQTPYWRSHRSQLGWSQMNYPSVLVNQRTRKEPSPKDYESMDLSYMHQKRPDSGLNQSKIYKPLSSASKNRSPVREEKLGSPPKGYKSSAYTLTTTPQLDRSIIKKELTKTENVSRIRPLSCEINHQDYDTRFTQKVTQVGEIKYYEKGEEEDRRHFKALPHTVLTEQSLKSMLTSQLEALNLTNLSWITNDHMNKIGFLAPNIVELNISRTVANDSTLTEMGRTCEYLKKMDISYCPNITEKGVTYFLNKLYEIEYFWAAGNAESITNASLDGLKDCNKLVSLNIEFCNKVTDEALEKLGDAAPPLKEIFFSACTGITGKGIISLLTKTGFKLEICDVSNMTQKEFGNDALKAIGCCGNLTQLSISGCTNIGFDGMNGLLHGDKDPQGVPYKKEDGLKHLMEFRMAGTSLDSDGAVTKLLQHSPELEILDLNNFKALSESSMTVICKALPNLRIMQLNFTEGIAEPFLVEMMATYPDIKFLRTINTYSDPLDNGLRVRLPLKKKKKKAKKGGKKKK
jgi:hypothetical protein